MRIVGSTKRSTDYFGRVFFKIGASAHAIAFITAVALCCLPVPSARAQSVVSACSGVSLPRSVVTDITGQILVPVITPLERLLGTLTLGTVNLGLAGSLANAAAGNPITLNVLDVNGNTIDIATNPNCVTQSDAFQLETPAGIAFGGNQITGLGTAGRLAIARETNAIAIGDAARTGVGAIGAVAIGDSASVTHAGVLGSVALGQNSMATGGTLANQAYLVGGTAPAEVNIGGRRLTGLSGGSADGDAVNVAQLRAAATALAGDALMFDTILNAYSARRGGVTQRITNIAAGTLGAGSTDAVNGAQLGATNDAVAGNTTSITSLGGSVTALNTSVGALQTDALQYDGTLAAFNANRGGVAQRITNIAAGVLNAVSSDAVNGSQLFTLGDSFASALGGGSMYNPASGLVTAGIAYGGTTYGTVQGAVSAIETSIGGTTGGTNQRYFRANSVMADSQAVGVDSTAIGPNSIASADGSIAAGRNTRADSAGSVAIGDGSSAISGKAVAIGAANVASGDGAVAIGDPNFAIGDGAVALGKDNQATGIGAVGLGDTNFATGNGAVALGQTNQAFGDSAIAIGGTNIVNGANAVAVGSNNVVTGVEALAFGVRNQVIGDGALAFGANIVTSGINTLAVGNYAAATGDNSSAFGNRSSATGINSTALGTMSKASQQYALAVGQNATALGYASTALGTGAVVTGLGSVALGTGSSATLDGSVALGGASSTTRGSVTGYAAFGVAALQTSVGEVAIARTLLYLDPRTGVLQSGGERQITGVAAGSAETDAINVAQLRGVSNTLGSAFAISLGGGAIYNATTGGLTGPAYFINGITYNSVGAALTAVGGQVGQVSANSISYDNAARDRVTLGGTSGTTVTNVTAGTLAAGSTDAVNGGQLFATNEQVAANTSAITALSNTVVGSTVTPVQYSNASSPTTSNRGVVTNDVTLVGANATAPVALHNVADGAVGAGSTDAVNGRQLNAVKETAQMAQTSASEAVALGRNSVQYDADRTSVSLGSGGAMPVSLRNVAAGVSTTDAVNVGQLTAGLDRAISTSNAYTDSRIGQIAYDLRDARRDASGGTAAAMALATIPQAYGPGMGMGGMGVSTWRGESAIAFGVSKASADGRIVVKAGATYNTRGHGGGAGGIGFGF